MPGSNKLHRLPPLIFAAMAAIVAATAQRPSHTQLPPDPDAGKPIVPTIPDVDRHTPGRVFLEQADSLVANPAVPDGQILIGNVVFRRGDMLMYCDSACFYTSATADSMEAFGNVHMQQGDTLFLYGDRLEYSGSRELATIYADDYDVDSRVRLINRDVTLVTTVLNYDLGLSLGYYEVGGVLSDPHNTLESIEGEYSPSTKDASFYRHVVLDGISDSGDSMHLYTDTLIYNTESRLATITCPSRIVTKDGVIYTDNGMFDTNTSRAWLYERSTVRTNRGNTLTGDTLFYDRELGFGEAFGMMSLTDSARQVTLEGEYGFFNELTDSAFVTGRARALEYSGTDTLYLHAETIRAFTVLPDSAAGQADTTRLMIAHPGVRFFRRDIQGVCDSMTFVQSDSTLRMDIHPVVWSDNRQIFGNVIHVYMNDSTVDRAHLPQFAFMAEHIEGDYFNQLSGREMIAFMADGHLSRLDVNGSVQGIMLPVENDSTYNKVANVTSSFLSATFGKNELERAHMWDQTSGTVTPLYLAKKSLFRLPKFAWYEVLRPLSPDSIFTYPPEWHELLLIKPDNNEE